MNHSILVDGISYYEHEEIWREDFETVVACLGKVQAVDSMPPRHGAVIKLLLTSPTTSSSALFDDLDMDERVRLRTEASRNVEKEIAMLWGQG